MNFKTGLLLALSITIPLLVSGQQKPANQQRDTDQQLAKTDQMFLKAIIQEDIAEINLGKMALQKSSNAQVKDYAETKILGADPQMRDRAEAIAKKYGMRPPTGPNTMQKQVQGELSKKSGKLFDNAYMVYETSKQHGDDVLVQTEIKSTHNSQLKSYATEEQKPVHEAATSARTVSKSVSSGMTHYKEPGSK